MFAFHITLFDIKPFRQEGRANSRTESSAFFTPSLKQHLGKTDCIRPFHRVFFSRPKVYFSNQSLTLQTLFIFITFINKTPCTSFLSCSLIRKSNKGLWRAIGRGESQLCTPLSLPSCKCAQVTETQKDTESLFR